jgi:hypothetical protein
MYSDPTVKVAGLPALSIMKLSPTRRPFMAATLAKVAVAFPSTMSTLLGVKRFGWLYSPLATLVKAGVPERSPSHSRAVCPSLKMNTLLKACIISTDWEMPKPTG